MLFGNRAEAITPLPDPEGTIRIGGIRVTLEEPKAGDVSITLHDKRISHYKLFTVIEALLREKGYDVGAQLNQAGATGKVRSFAERPSTILLHTHKPDHTPALTLDAITAECKELSGQIADAAALTDVFGKVEQHKRNAGIAERFRNNGGAQRG